MKMSAQFGGEDSPAGAPELDSVDDKSTWLQSLSVEQPLPRQIADQIETAIVEGFLPPGTKLAEEEMAAAFGTSRTPVREALRQLEREGLVTLVSRRGARVTEISIEAAADIYYCRACLHALAARMAAVMASDEDLRQLAELEPKLAAAAAADDRKAYVRFSIAFDLQLAAITGNTLLRDLLQRMGKTTSRLRFASVSAAGRIQQSLEQHRLVLEALEQRDAASAESRMRDIIVSAWEVLARSHYGLSESDLARPRFALQSVLGSPELQPGK